MHNVIVTVVEPEKARLARPLVLVVRVLDALLVLHHWFRIRADNLERARLPVLSTILRLTLTYPFAVEPVGIDFFLRLVMTLVIMVFVLLLHLSKV